MSLRNSVFYMAVTAGVLGFIPASAWAQEQPEAATEIPTAKFSAVGEVNAASVNVRSGPAESHYPTMKLNKGDKVLVVGQKFDWLKIKPPQGSFSYVAKIYVDRDGTGATGTVSRNDVVIRAGSSLSPMMTEVQTKLNTGDKVQILGEQNEYYKIAPPEGAYLYIAKPFVSLVRAATTNESVPAPLAAAEGATTQPAMTGEATTPAAAPTPPRTQAPAEPGEPAAPARQAPKAPVARANDDTELQFRRIEARFKQAESQPLEERPIADLLKEYQQLQQKSDDLSATSRRMVQIRVATLQALQTQQSELVQTRQANADFEARQKELQAQRQAIEDRIKGSAVQVYTAVGQLQTSTIQKDGQPLLRLVDPADGRTLVYISGLDPKNASLMDKFVGVKGDVVRDDRLGVEVIDPSAIESVDQAKVLRGVTAKIYPPSAAKGQ